ncbi:MAG: alkaline phosphatase PhoX [Verrucomicrobiota bacterium]
MTSTLSRRRFLQQSAAVALGFAGLRSFLQAAPVRPGGTPSPFGPLQRDPAKIFDLPPEFRYHQVGEFGARMDDGLICPGAIDGSASFAMPYGKVLLVRNHELEPNPKLAQLGAFGPGNRLLSRDWARRMYDPGNGRVIGYGGTTSLLYNPQSGQAERLHLSLAGTERNCAGGPMPWDSWISCEETTVTPKMTPGLRREHGYNFEVSAYETGAVEPVPLRDMGRFRHEAVAADPATGFIYQTEDLDDGLIYRFRPNQPGKLRAGGRLEALAIKGRPSLDTRNWQADAIRTGERLPVEWVGLRDVESPKDDLRYQGFGRGAARFARAEGMWYGNDAVYFACTTGGRARLGQIWKLELGRPQELELFVEPNDGNLLENADNLCVAPWGDLIVCEDNTKHATSSEQYLIGVTPEGKCYRLGRNALNTSELSGVNFSPDGQTLFVNIMYPGATLAISGPWEKALRSRLRG